MTVFTPTPAEEQATKEYWTAVANRQANLTATQKQALSDFMTKKENPIEFLISTAKLIPIIFAILTTTQKYIIAAAIVVVSLLIMFRYETVPTNKVGVVIQHDRWTGTTQMCVVQADRTFKCGK